MGIHWEGINEGGDAILLTGDSDGDVTRGYAIEGGRTPDFFNSLRIQRGNELIPVRAHRRADLKDGDIVIQKTAGGCGVGDPFTRDTDRVLADVRNGFVSIEKARRDYGVVIDPITLALDVAATDHLRKEGAQVASQPALPA